MTMVSPLISGGRRNCARRIEQHGLSARFPQADPHRAANRRGIDGFSSFLKLIQIKSYNFEFYVARFENPIQIKL
jgi:hypothetical protein